MFFVSYSVFKFEFRSFFFFWLLRHAYIVLRRRGNAYCKTEIKVLDKQVQTKPFMHLFSRGETAHLIKIPIMQGI